ncbi:MAG TPA: MGMT family protein [Bryobacteraceae bacterium]|nr:MGMT family protein [Bryobacteraceae bacterium]
MKPSGSSGQPSKTERMERAICDTIRSIPKGKVATYGGVAEAAGYPRYHRQVAQVLGKYGERLPWHRVLGAGGQLKTPAPWNLEQRMRLELEGVRFRGKRVDMKAHENRFFRGEKASRKL